MAGESGRNRTKILKKVPVRRAKACARPKPGHFFDALKAAAKTAEAREMRKRLDAIGAKISAAPAGAAMDDARQELGRIYGALAKNYILKALFQLRVKTLLEEAEFKRTGTRVIFD